MIYKSFSDWVVAEVLSKYGQQERLDGQTTGGNRDIFGEFNYNGKYWLVHGDTRIDRVMRAYNAIKTGKQQDPFVVETASVRKCLNLVKNLRIPKEPKYFYVYEKT